MQQKIGQYNLMTKLAEKYLHSIYLASPINEPERQVVLTLFASSLCHSPQERERLLLKVARIKQLQHNHVVPILDMGIEKEQIFTVREYLPHESVRSLLKSLSPQGLELQDALNLILQVGDALIHAHSLQIFHGNLKPENVLLDANGQAVLTDFNLINKHRMLIQDHMTDKYLLCYMAPEQLFGTGDAKSDQYMLGCLTYELITGRPPFVVQNIDLMHSQYSYAKPISFFEGNAHLPASLQAAVLKTLEKDPDRRFANLSQFLESIRSIVSPSVISAATHVTNFKSKRLLSHFMLSKRKGNASPAMIKYTAFPSLDSQKQEHSHLVNSNTANVEEWQHASFLPQVSVPRQAKPTPLIKKPTIDMEEWQHASFLPQVSVPRQAKPTPLAESHVSIVPFLQWVQKRVNFQLSHRSLRREQAYTLTRGETELNLTSEKGHAPHEATYHHFTRYFLRTAIGLALLLSVIIGIVVYAFWLPGRSVPDTHLYTASSISDNSMANSTPTLLTNAMPGIRMNSTPAPVTSLPTTTITNTIATSRMNSAPTLVASSPATTKASSVATTKANSAPAAADPTLALIRHLQRLIRHLFRIVARR